jgi:DNA-binding MarR family transcriptional regulator
VKDPYKCSKGELDDIHIGSLGRTIFDISNFYDHACIETLRTMGYPLNLAHLNVMPYLDLDGTSLSVLAQRAGMTRQSAWELLRSLEAHGYLKRTPDPKNSRAHIIFYTDKGMDLHRDACLVMLRLEEDLAKRIGKKHLKSFGTQLQTLRASYQAQPPAITAESPQRKKASPRRR